MGLSMCLSMVALYTVFYNGAYGDNATNSRKCKRCKCFAEPRGRDMDGDLARNLLE